MWNLKWSREWFEPGKSLNGGFYLSLQWAVCVRAGRCVFTFRPHLVGSLTLTVLTHPGNNELKKVSLSPHPSPFLSLPLPFSLSISLPLFICLPQSLPLSVSLRLHTSNSFSRPRFLSLRPSLCLSLSIHSAGSVNDICLFMWREGSVWA